MWVASASDRMVVGEKFLTELALVGGLMVSLSKVRKSQSVDGDAMVVPVSSVFSQPTRCVPESQIESHGKVEVDRNVI